MSDFAWFCMIPITGIIMYNISCIVDSVWGQKEEKNKEEN